MAVAAVVVDVDVVVVVFAVVVASFAVEELGLDRKSALETREATRSLVMRKRRRSRK